MINKLYAKAETWIDWYVGKDFRIEHPVRATVLDAAVLATWTCWMIALTIVAYYIWR